MKVGFAFLDNFPSREKQRAIAKWGSLFGGLMALNEVHPVVNIHLAQTIGPVKFAYIIAAALLLSAYWWFRPRFT